MIKPSAIGLEASSYCQLRCPSCPTTSKAIHPAIGSGFLRFADFRKLLDENPWVRAVELSNYGEIFLNPELHEIIEYAFRKRVALSAVNGVNLNHARPEILEGLVKYRFHSMRCSIDGASEETYRIYRVRGSFERVIENIRTLNGFKRQYGSRHPLLLWQFVAFGHNEHEIPAARKLAAELGMAFQVKLSWDDGHSPVRDHDRIRQEAGVGAATRAEFRQRHGTDYMQSLCHQLWNRPQINWDGKVLGCCRNFWGDFGGNAFRDGLLSSLNNEKIVHARAMLTGQRESRPDIPCTTCDIYLHRKARQQWVTPRPTRK